MTIWTSLLPASTTVDPGSSSTVQLRLRNTGDVVDEYRFAVVGDIAPYVSVEPESLRLYPGTTGVVEVTIAPPRTSDAAAGPHPYAVQVVPAENPEATTVAEGNATFTPFSEVRAELVPQTVRGLFRGRPKLAVDNLGNTALTASISGGKSGDELSYETFPSNVQIASGRAAFVDVRLKPRQISWVGRKQQKPYAVAVRSSGAEPLTLDGTFVQRSLLPVWVSTLLGLVLALTLAGAMLWFTRGATVSSRAQEKLQPAGASALPTPPPSPPQPTPSATTTGPQPKKSAGGGGGTKKKPAQGNKPQGPLPITSADRANLFVQFVQVRLREGAGGCKLTDPVTVGKLDPATETALKCFQRSNDAKYGSASRLVATDGLGNLGRTTMTALLAAHFVAAQTVPLKADDDSTEVPWVRNILLWGTQMEFDNGDLATTVACTKANIIYLRDHHQLAEKPTSGDVARIKEYQGQSGTAQSGVVDETTLNEMKWGYVDTPALPGTVTATDWLPPPMD